MFMSFEKRFTLEMEKKWQNFWLDNNFYAFDIDSDKPVYSIDTPPPFTSGKLHMGHVLSYSFIDFIARYKRMKGFNVFFPQGWDTQGFPTEVKVEKKYGKKDREEFRQHCIDWTNQCIKDMKEQMIAMGFSPDWNYEYRTMDPNYHKAVQKSLIQTFKTGDVYQAEHPVFWCPKCVSALAKTDMDEVQKQGMLNNLIFELENGEKVEIATTRPELLFACVAVLYNPKDDRYNKLSSKTIKTPLGKLVPLIADKDVDKEFGTGLVMLCTYGDKQDVIWAYRYNLKPIQVINKYGKMINSDFLNGLKVKQAKEKMIEFLKQNGKLTKQTPLTQTVKIHDRCKTTPELILSKQWFGRLKGYEQQIKQKAKQINWHPSFGIHYLTDWCDNLEWDWVISRQRIFGTPLPFFFCENCNKIYAAEENELPVNPPLLDKKCPVCGQPLKPETSTCDCWVDSSITPLVISGWLDNPKLFNKVYPFDLRPQGVEIVRTWAFYTIYRCNLLTGKIPFKNILLNGNVLAPDGKKMSKSLGNTISPEKLINEYGVDSVRQWAALSGAMAKDRPFNYQDIKFSKNFLNKLWNASKFIFQTIEKYVPEDNHIEHLKPIDYWILFRLNSTIKKVNELFEQFKFQTLIKEIHNFFWFEFCDYYLEFVKYRIYSDKEDLGAKLTLYIVLKNSLLLLTPITPHITEEIYHKVFTKDVNISITQEKYPENIGLNIEFSKNIEEVGSIVKQILSDIRKQKANQKKSIKDMAQTCTIFLPEEQYNLFIKHFEEFKQDIQKTANVEQILIEKGEHKIELTFNQ